MNSRFVTAILLIVTMGYVATDLYLPSLPAITEQLQTEPGLVQLSIPLYMLSFGIAHLFFGPLSDKIGRRPIMIYGLLFSLVGTVACVFIGNVWMLIAARFVQGIGLGAAVSVTRPAIRDVAHGDQFAHIASVMATGAAVFMAGAPALGGYLQEHFGWRSPFIFLTLYIITVILVAIFWIPETHKERNPNALKPKVFFGNYLYLITSPVFLGYTLASSCALGGALAYFTASPFVLQRSMGLSPVIYGWTVIIIAAGMGVGGVLNRLFLKYFGRHRSIVIGVFLLFLGGLSMLVASHWPNPYTFVIPMGFYAVGMAVTTINGSAGAFTPFPKIAGFAGALFGCMFILGAAFTSSVMASFQRQTTLLVALFLLVAAALALVLQWIAFLAVDKK